MLRRNSQIQEVQKLYPVKQMVSELIGLDEIQWGRYAFCHEPLERKFTDSQKEEYTGKAFSCGRQEAREIRGKYPSLSLREIVKECGFTLDTPDLPTGGGHVIFAQYTEPDEILIFRDCVKKAARLIEREKLEHYFTEEKIEELLLAHELFHGIEYQKKKSIFTQTERIELWRKPFSNRSRIICLSEMAAMAFAGELAQSSFSPYVLDVFLMYSYNKEAACALYEEIMEEAGAEKRKEEMPC